MTWHYKYMWMRVWLRVWDAGKIFGIWFGADKTNFRREPDIQQRKDMHWKSQETKSHNFQPIDVIFMVKSLREISSSAENPQLYARFGRFSPIETKIGDFTFPFLRVKALNTVEGSHFSSLPMWLTGFITATSLHDESFALMIEKPTQMAGTVGFRFLCLRESKPPPRISMRISLSIASRQPTPLTAQDFPSRINFSMEMLSWEGMVLTLKPLVRNERIFV